MQFIMLVWVKIGKKFVIIRGLSSQASCLVIEIWHNAKWIFLNHVQYMLNNTVTARNTRDEFSRSIGCSRALAEIHNSCKSNLVERSQLSTHFADLVSENWCSDLEKNNAQSIEDYRVAIAWLWNAIIQGLISHRKKENNNWIVSNVWYIFTINSYYT